MGGMRALLASLGAGISLVAGAALSLLVVSFVFAYDGLTGSTDAPTASAAVLVQDTPAADSANARAGGERRSGAVVITAPRRSSSPQSAGTKRRKSREATRGETSPSPPSAAPDASADPAPGDPSSQPSARAPGAGDGVRDLGAAVSSTVDTTGAATAPLLGAPVSQAVQKVLDAIDDLLKGTTGALAGALDQAVAAKR